MYWLIYYVSFTIHNICVWYPLHKCYGIAISMSSIYDAPHDWLDPWYTIHSIHDRQYLCLVSNDTQYLYTVSMIHIFLSQVSTMHKVCDWYPGYPIFMSGNHNKQYFCSLITMVNNYLCIVYPIPLNLSLSNHWRNDNSGRLVTVTSEICNPWPNWTPCQLWSKSVKNCAPMR